MSEATALYQLSGMKRQFRRCLRHCAANEPTLNAAARSLPSSVPASKQVCYTEPRIDFRGSACSPSPHAFWRGLEGSMARRILIADDSPLIRKMLCEMFEVEEDYDI